MVLVDPGDIRPEAKPQKKASIGGLSPEKVKALKTAAAAGSTRAIEAFEKHERDTQNEAATMLQAAVRGKSGREKAVRMVPCNEYRVNMAGKVFGECMCGHPKAAHSAAALCKKVGAQRTKQDSTVLREKMTAKGYCACEKYMVNMQSASFGECTCGQPKSAHSPAALASEEKTKMDRVNSTELRSKMVQRDKCACEKYVVNMEAKTFGECICGEPKANHTAEALAAGEKSKAALKAEDEVRSKMVQHGNYCDCDVYEIDMCAEVFGTCVCGEPKNKHSPAALEAGR